MKTSSARFSRADAPFPEHEIPHRIPLVRDAHRRDYVNITDKVEAIVRQSGVQEGLCLVNAMHITASVYINDAEAGLMHDYDAWLEKLTPHAPTSQYQHNRTGEDNVDAHLKRQVMGREVVVAIT